VLQYPAIIGTDFGFEVYYISVASHVFIADIKVDSHLLAAEKSQLENHAYSFPIASTGSSRDAL
jgi:hypothetical protein